MTKKPTNGHAPASNGARRHLRSQEWFNNPHNPGMTALYMERYLNYGLTRAELQSGKPIIGIAQTGNDLSPCNRHHIELAHRVREGIREAGGIAMEFPTHPIQETGKRPTAALDRNLAYLGLVEILYGYPLDGVVLTTGCDKTTPACMMAAATVNLPAIVLSGGPMLNGWHAGERTGSGTIVWKSRERLAAGEIDYEEFMEIVASSAPSVGHCNTMGTASTMNGLAEALGFSLPGCAAIPAPYRERGQIAYETGKRAVEMVWEDLKPSDILTRKAFENCIVINSAIGGSTNAPIHINALARHIGVELSIDDWQKFGHDVPLLVNMQPAGFYLGEEFHRAGGVPAVVRELMKHKRIHEDAVTVNGRGIGENCANAPAPDNDVIRAYDKPLVKDAGFLVLKGNLFDSAIMKTSVISKEFRDRYLSNPKDLNAFEGRAIVFEGPEDYHERIDDPSLDIDESCMLFVRGTGPIGYPGGAEVVNMQPPAALIKRGILALPCIGDGRQSGTSGSPSILNASPEAAANGGLAILKTGDKVRIDLNKGSANILISDDEVKKRHAELMANGGFKHPANQTPWQEIYRNTVGQQSTGACMELATRYQNVAGTFGVARDNH
ncbi:dihydroxy-acid dehydratase [Bradyrhizobium sp. JR7.2]|jgi:dihydroxy-acid dehydratase|uniref:Dihydroxy-acid dehydratase family protein n=1 Tax=Bradyrhizobium barranii TaxID=2992140 RepID=A0ABY3QWF7_9BRAD|nr:MULTISPECIES: IlvD/Edd family dehydratase [Bradyrhizobium]UFW90377.1 dihydroxy-acid dehydratase family protein [Bradyrhizobium japonicum]WFT99073.1 dihydroxy-acid dehydratase family protein [Bradyrhizobium barranii]CUU19332.1 Xylonate dehydratase EC 42182 CDS [Bradyrhizobium sp.]